MKKTIWVWASALFFLSCEAAASSPAESIEAIVKDVSPFPVPASGYITTWVRITVLPYQAEQTSDILLAYVSKTQPMPKVGEHCIFTVHKRLAGGFVGRDRIR